MSISVRKYIAAASAIFLGVVLAAGMVGMPDADETIASYGQLLTDISIEERNSLNTISGVLFDLRALDSLGELLILFTASAGLHIVLLKLSGERVREEPLKAIYDRKYYPDSETIRAVCLAFVTPVTVYGIFICLRGHLTVGGGFQGGVIIASALILLYLAGYYKVQKTIAPDDTLDHAETIGMGGVILAGTAGLFLTGGLFANVLPLGETGNLFSAGLIPVLSILVGLEAAAAVTMIFSHLQRQPLKRESP